MSITNFQQTLWNGEILRVLRRNYVYANLMARGPYGGVVKGGNTVRILGIGDVTIKDYSRDTNMDAPEAITDNVRTLVIDQQKYFNFAVDDIDQAQSMNGGSLVTDAMTTAANGMVDIADTFCASHYTSIAAGNSLGTDLAPLTVNVDGTGTGNITPWNLMVQLRTKAQKANIPGDARFLVVPPEFSGLLLNDPKFVAGYSAGQAANLSSGLVPGVNGYVGHYAGFNIFESNAVPNVSGLKYKLIGGMSSAWAWAENIDESEAYRPESRFGDAMKGLHVYGASVVRPLGLVLATVNFV